MSHMCSQLLFLRYLTMTGLASVHFGEWKAPKHVQLLWKSSCSGWRPNNSSHSAVHDAACVGCVAVPHQAEAFRRLQCAGGCQACGLEGGRAGAPASWVCLSAPSTNAMETRQQAFERRFEAVEEAVEKYNFSSADCGASRTPRQRSGCSRLMGPRAPAQCRPMRCAPAACCRLWSETEAAPLVRNGTSSSQS
jgi:hypothetical protein